jgi:hypothetical protein
MIIRSHEACSPDYHYEYEMVHGELLGFHRKWDGWDKMDKLLEECFYNHKEKEGEEIIHHYA